MMTRFQVSLDQRTLRRARQRARQLGISLNEYVRRLVAKDLDARVLRADPSVVFNLGSSGGSDVARHKDAMLEEGFAS
jgi:hypothetical protein